MNRPTIWTSNRARTLTEMLSNYAGTLLLISHDRYLLNAVTTKTLGLTGDGGGARRRRQLRRLA